MNIFTQYNKPISIEVVQHRHTLEYVGQPYLDRGECARQILSKSHQPHITQFEHEDTDPGGRFFSEKTLTAWVNTKDRTALPRIDRENKELTGITWFRPAAGENPFNREMDVTFGIRMFEGYVGKGQAESYARASHFICALFAPVESGFWLSYKKGNHAARRLYDKLGYHYDGEIDNTVFMSKPLEVVL